MQHLKIYIDRLKDGHQEVFHETLSPEFLHTEDKELQFQDPVILKAEAYIAEDHLVIHLNAETTAILPCSICNDPVRMPISLKNSYLTKPLSDIKGAVFDLEEEIRESIVLNAPLFAECHNGKCPERENMKKYLKKDERPEKGEKDPVNFPFSHLDE